MLAALIGVARGTRAQDVEESLRRLGRENAVLYARPVTSGVGAAMSSAWFHTAEPKRFPHLEIGVRVVGADPPGRDERFTPVLPERLSVPELGGRTFLDPYGTGGDRTTPAATGGGEGARFEPAGEFREALLGAGLDPDDFALRLPDGFDVATVPFLTLQASLGLPRGTEVTFRVLPSVEIDDDVGSIQGVGGGLKHDLDQWLPVLLPVDLAIEGGIQRLDVGGYLEARARHVSLVTSRTLSILTLYGAAGFEDSEADVSFVVDNPRLDEDARRIEFTQEGENDVRFTVGLGVDLAFLQVNGEFSSGEYRTVSAGLGLTF